MAQYETDGRLVCEFTYGGRPPARASFYIGCGVESGEVYETIRSEGIGRQPEEVCNYAVKKRVEFDEIIDAAEALRKEIVRVAKHAYNAYSRE